MNAHNRENENCKSTRFLRLRAVSFFEPMECLATRVFPQHRPALVCKVVFTPIGVCPSTVFQRTGTISELALRASELDQTNHLHLSQNDGMVGLTKYDGQV